MLDGVEVNDPLLEAGTPQELENRRSATPSLNERLQVNLQAVAQPFGGQDALNPGILAAEAARNWYAVFTLPQNEKSVVKHLELWEIESFLPTYETVRVWKNRQRMKLLLPLFPAYVFVRINPIDRGKVLRSPGVLRIVGNSRGPIPLLDSEVEFLRSDFCRQRVEPYRELVVGEKVRVRSGIMQGVQGTLVRKSSSMRFVLTLELINQNAAVLVDAEDLEPIMA